MGTSRKVVIKQEMAVVSKMFCSSSQVVLCVRTRPHVVGGGGFVVTDMNSREVVFRVDGCGVLGKKDQMTLKDAYQTPLLLIRRKGGIVEALSLHKQWGGYDMMSSGSVGSHHRGHQNKLVFTLKDPQSSSSSSSSSCLISRISSGGGGGVIRVVAVEQNKDGSEQNIYNFHINGYFPDRDCTIVDSEAGNIIAQVGVNKEMRQEVMDVYHIVVKPGIDQAFVVGVIAVLDYIHNGSTTC